MALTPMRNFLSALAADYTATELSITPDDVMFEEPDEETQVTHLFDDGSDQVIDLADGYFYNRISWNKIPEGEANTIFSFYFDPAKANRKAKSFYWHHPLDGQIYTVKFASALQRQSFGLYPDSYSITSLRLKILGYKPGT